MLNATSAQQVRGHCTRFLKLFGNIHGDPNRRNSPAALGPVSGVFTFRDAIAGANDGIAAAFLVVGDFAFEHVADGGAVFVGVEGDDAAGGEGDLAHAQGAAPDGVDLP